LMINDGKLDLDFVDVIIKDCCVTHQGEVCGSYKDIVG